MCQYHSGKFYVRNVQNKPTSMSDSDITPNNTNQTTDPLNEQLDGNPWQGVYFPSWVLLWVILWETTASIIWEEWCIHPNKIAFLCESQIEQVTCWQLIWASNFFSVHPLYIYIYMTYEFSAILRGGLTFQNRHIKLEILCKSSITITKWVKPPPISIYLAKLLYFTT